MTDVGIVRQFGPGGRMVVRARRSTDGQDRQQEGAGEAAGGGGKDMASLRWRAEGVGRPAELGDNCFMDAFPKSRFPALVWEQVGTVMLDMDGTLLDLHFDNHFWRDHLPARLAQLRGVDEAEIRPWLIARTNAVRGQLAWYCLDYWARELEVDIMSLKREVMHLIAVHEHVESFLAAVHASGRQVMLVTNAHRDSLELKLACTEIGCHFHRVISAHELGCAKEEPGFWDRLREQAPFEPAESLFVDDNLDVLRAARDYGIAHLRAVRRPDSRGPEVETQEFPVIGDFRELGAPEVRSVNWEVGMKGL
jgi:5'-nucleotidase